MDRSTISTRFWSHVDRSGGPDDCWPWTASSDRYGYGQFKADGLVVRSHRYAYELQVGPIPTGLHIDHLCRTRACQNARHMEPVTQQVNTHRGTWSTRSHCPQGHQYASNNLYVNPRSERQCRNCRNEASRRYRAAHRESVVV